MNTFANAMMNEPTTTTNGMAAVKRSGNACVDLFYKIGALRNQDPIPAFVAAFAEDQELAIRILLWSRDVRGGAGERDTFRTILRYLCVRNPETVYSMIPNIPEVGRWDDLSTIILSADKELRDYTAHFWMSAIVNDKNQLAAKWAPRKGPVAAILRKAWSGLTPKQYRKILVSNTNVVETPMCAKDWENIEFSHVPSNAMALYKRAFFRNSNAFKEYAEKLASGDSSVKINAAAIFPHDVIKDITRDPYGYNGEMMTIIEKQWEALPNYVGTASVFPMVDCSGSMRVAVSGSLQAIDISLSLGLYMADKNTGPFKDMFMTFSSDPTIQVLKGSIVDKIVQLNNMNLGLSTNLEAAFDRLLEIAVKMKVKPEDMPAAIMIISDMQFNAAIDGRRDSTALQMIADKYNQHGYKKPGVIFWNLVDYGNIPSASNENGVALISGFSPAVLKSVLQGDYDSITPTDIMLRTVMIPRYNRV